MGQEAANRVSKPQNRNRNMKKLKKNIAHQKNVKRNLNLGWTTKTISRVYLSHHQPLHLAALEGTRGGPSEPCERKRGDTRTTTRYTRHIGTYVVELVLL